MYTDDELRNAAMNFETLDAMYESIKAQHLAYLDESDLALARKDIRRWEEIEPKKTALAEQADKLIAYGKEFLG